MPTSFLPLMRQAYTKLENAMKGRTQLATCPFDLVSWFLLVTGSDDAASWSTAGDEEKAMVRKAWSLVHAWVTQVKSAEDLAAFHAMQCRCSPSHRRDQWHAQAVNEYESATHSSKTSRVALGTPSWHMLFVFTLRYNSPWIRGPVSEGQGPFNFNVNHSSLRELKRRQSWPTSLGGVLPHGPLGTLQGLMQWYAIDSPLRICRCLFTVFDLLLRLCRPLVLPYIVTSPKFVQLVIVRPIHRSQALLEESISKGGDELVYGVQEVHRLILLFDTLLQTLCKESCTVAECTIFIKQDPQALFDAYFRLTEFGKEMEDIVEAAPYSSSLHTTLNATAFNKTRQNLLERAMEVRLYASHEELPPQVQRRFDGVIDLMVSHTKSGRKSGYATMDYLRQQFARLLHDDGQVCLSPNCNNTLVHTKLKVCLGCARVHYCSRQCQRRAWRHPLVPHRSICQLITDFARHFGISFYRGDERDEQVIETTGQRILDHFAGLTELKMHSFDGQLE